MIILLFNTLISNTLAYQNIKLIHVNNKILKKKLIRTKWPTNYLLLICHHKRFLSSSTTLNISININKSLNISIN